MKKSPYLRGKAIAPQPIKANCTVTDLVERYFQAYNGGRLSEAARLFADKMLEKDVTVGMSITGALTPAGLGGSCIVPMMEAGFVDWIICTGANLYHDTHFSIGHSLHQGSPFYDDRQLRKDGVIRIYDIVFPYEVLLSTDSFFRSLLRSKEFQRPMSTAEFHNLAGKYIYESEKTLGVKNHSILSAAYKYSVPVYTSSPGDSSIGMNVAGVAREGNKFMFDVSADVNETAAIVLNAKRKGGQSGVFILGGGSPKNFLLQTEPQIQEVLGISEKGHDYFLQITDARPDTGGLSGATPSEAVSWGKVDPDKLPDTVVAYLDSTVALPVIASYAMGKRKKRPLKRLYDKRPQMLELLATEYGKAQKKKSKK